MAFRDYQRFGDAENRVFKELKLDKTKLQAVVATSLRDTLRTNESAVARLCLDSDALFHGARIHPYMMDKALILTYMDRLRLPVREQAVNRLIASGLLNRYNKIRTVSQDPIVMLLFPAREAPTEALFERLRPLLDVLDAQFEWDNLDHLLKTRLKQHDGVNDVSVAKARPKGWYNPLHNSDLVCHNRIVDGKEVDTWRCSLRATPTHPRFRIEIARAIHTDRQYVVNIRTPVYVTGSLRGKLVSAHVHTTILRLTLVIEDDRYHDWLTDPYNHKMYFFPHSGVKLPFFSLRALMLRALIPNIVPDTTLNMGHAGIYFVLDYLFKQDRHLPRREKLETLDRLLRGQPSDRALLGKLTTQATRTAQTLSPAKRKRLYHDVGVAMTILTEAFMASEMLPEQRIVSFFTPQSLEDSHY